MQSQSHYHSLSNNQNYVCREYDRYHTLVNDDPRPVKYRSMFLFDIPDGNYIEIEAYKRDFSLPETKVTVSSVYLDGHLSGTFDPNNKSDYIQGCVVQIYKNDEYNAAVFSRHNKTPCMFGVPSVNFAHRLLVLGKRPTHSGYSTMTLLEDENQKILYHTEKMRELHEEFQKYFDEQQTPRDVMNDILELILPHTYD